MICANIGTRQPSGHLVVTEAAFPGHNNAPYFGGSNFEGVNGFFHSPGKGKSF